MSTMWTKRSTVQDLEKILVLPADQGEATVIMDKADYDGKLLQMLRDENTYKPLDRTPLRLLRKE